MWMEELPNGKYKFFERYKDPYTEKLKKVSVTMEKKTPQARIWRTIGQPQQTKYRFVLPQFLRLAENHRTNFAKRT